MVRRPQAMLVIAGRATVAEQTSIAASFDTDARARVFFTGWLDPAALAALICRADVCLSPVPPDPLYATATPTKIVEYLACGRRVVASELPDHRLVLAGTGLGAVVAYDRDAFATAIDHALDAGAPSAAEVARAVAWIDRHRSYARIAPIVLAAYRRMCR